MSNNIEAMSEECPKAKIQKVQKKLEETQEPTVELLTNMLGEVSDLFKDAISYMTGQSAMMQELMKKAQVNSLELRLTRLLLLTICAAAIAIQLLK